MAKNNKGYGFPIRNTDELVKFLEEEVPDVGFTREDIIRPKV